VRKLAEYSDIEIQGIVREEGWDQPLAPVRRVRLTLWLEVAFWALRVYILAMLGVVGYAFFHAAR
jgi:hypothetical protein